jgi:putative nucleotidyltransferase with HDIG domain
MDVVFLTLGIGGSLGVLGGALALGLRHGIDWDHIAAITDITSTTSATAEPEENWLTDEPGVLLTDESHHEAAELVRRRPIAGGQVAVAAPSPAASIDRTGIAALWANQRRAIILGTLYAVGHGTVVTALGLLAILAAVADGFDLSLYGDSRVSLAFVPIFAAILLFGLWGLAVVVAVAVVASAVGVDRPVHKTLFNFGALMLAGGASVLILQPFKGASHADEFPQVIGPAALAVATNFAINSVLVAVAIGLSTGYRVWSVWDEKFRWLWPHYLVLGGLGLAIAAAFLALGLWGILVFLVPPLMMRISIKQYLDRTTRSVVELREAHDDLQEAHLRVVEAMTSLERAYDGTLRALVTALDARDSETHGHSQRVADVALAMAEEMGIERDTEVWQKLQWGALLHDVGKIGVPDHILRKPGELSEEEWQTMKEHPGAGYEIVRRVEFLGSAAEVVHAHHERFDGSGYPRNLRGEEIPLGARIFAVADAFDAMTSDRPYRPARAPEQALAEILRNSGSQFDPSVVKAFLSVYQTRFFRGDGKGDSEDRLGSALKKAILEAAGLGGSS